MNGQWTQWHGCGTIPTLSHSSHAHLNHRFGSLKWSSALRQPEDLLIWVVNVIKVLLCWAQVCQHATDSRWRCLTCITLPVCFTFMRTHPDPETIVTLWQCTHTQRHPVHRVKFNQETAPQVNTRLSAITTKHAPFWLAEGSRCIKQVTIATIQMLQLVVN